MRNKIVFFILGAILATIAYHIGDMEKVDADSPTVFQDVWIKGDLVVSGGAIIVEDVLDSEQYPKSSIQLRVSEGNAGISIVNSRSEIPETPAASGLVLMANTGDDGESYSAINLSGNHDKNSWNLWSFEPK